MDAMTVPFVLPFAAFAFLWICLGATAVAAHALARRSLARLDARQRAGLLLCLSVSPILVAGVAAILGFAPAIGGLVVDRHCHPDTGCVPHVPTLYAGAAVAAASMSALIAAAYLALKPILTRLRRSVVLARVLTGIADSPDHRASDSRRAGSSESSAPPFAIVDTADRFACCAGLLRPRLLVSRGLVDMLSPQQLRIVLAHEQAHASRYDNLRRMLAQIGMWPVPSRWRRGLLQDLALASEMACDREAAAEAGGAAAVIETLAMLTHGPSMTTGRATAAFTHTDCPPAAQAARSRVEALETQRASSRLPIPALVALSVATYAVLTVTTTYVAHHGTELLLAWLG